MWLVFKKEVIELLRDRKTLFFMIALPLLFFPIIFGGVFYFSGKAIQEAQEKTLNFAVVGGEFAPILTNQLSARDDLTIVKSSLSSDDEAGIKAFVKTEKVDFVLVVPSTFSNDVLSSGQQTIMLYLNDAGLNMVQRRVNEVVKEIENTNQQAAFISLGVSEAIQEGLLNPIVIEKVSIADKREDLGKKLVVSFPTLSLSCVCKARCYQQRTSALAKKNGGHSRRY